jgi:hypothetical protein
MRAHDQRQYAFGLATRSYWNRHSVFPGIAVMRNVLHPSFECANPNVRSQLELSPNHLSDLPGTNITARLKLSRGGLVPKPAMVYFHT